jgi:hypothetical protein
MTDPIMGSLTLVGAISSTVSGLCALAIVADIISGNAQKMWIMNVVWPITALWSGPLGLYAYFRFGRVSTKPAMMAAQKEHRPPPQQSQPFPVLAGKATTHCGAGCTLGDLIAESLVLVLPLSLFGHKLFGAWLYDFILAFAFGIAFQYFTIKPMKKLSPGQGVVAALKADALSLTAWQLDMYGWMALTTFVLFHHELAKQTPVFWFMMQIAMLVGFLTSYPVNWWLLRRGIKEKM